MVVINQRWGLFESAGARGACAQRFLGMKSPRIMIIIMFIIMFIIIIIVSIEFFVYHYYHYYCNSRGQYLWRGSLRGEIVRREGGQEEARVEGAPHRPLLGGIP